MVKSYFVILLSAPVQKVGYLGFSLMIRTWGPGLGILGLGIGIWSLALLAS